MVNFVRNDMLSSKVIAAALFISLVVISAILAILSFDLLGDYSVHAATAISSIFFACICFFLSKIRKEIDESNQLLLNIINSIPEPIVAKDWDGNFTFCNQAVAELYNAKPEDMIGKDDFFFTNNREQADFFKQNVQQIMSSFERQEVFESSTDANTQQIKHFQSIKVPFKNQDGQLGIVVYAKDITTVMELKQEADRNKKRLAYVLDVSQEGLWEWNRLTGDVFHNDQWRHITGIPVSENTFAEFENCVVDEDKAYVKAALGSLITENKPYNIEFRMTRPDGKIIWIWDRGRVVEYDSDGNPTWLAGIMQDITQQKLNQKKIELLAYNDSLTLLPNRAQLDKKLKEVIAQSKQEDKYSAILFLDLDRFKLLNDTYGHQMGDLLLVEIGKRLQSSFRNLGTVARFGGDEFIVILPVLNKRAKVATNIAEWYAEGIHELFSTPIQLNNKVKAWNVEYKITTSIGGVIFKAEESTPEKILQLADFALNSVKESGGNSATIFSIEMQEELTNINKLQQQMRDSIKNGEFKIFLQPKYCNNQKIIGAEALVRWIHPELGLIPPNKFISIAEKSNFIIPIGKQVLEQACEQLEKWHNNPSTRHLSIAVNFSAKQISQNNFTVVFLNTIEPYTFDRSKLILEMTESVMVENFEDTIEKLTKLKSYGVQLSLDDFGTGYSSLSYLRTLPIDELKIDRSFVNDITFNEQAHVMVKSIIDLGHNFNLNIVSEGVETKEQFDLLCTYDVHCFQGFYFSKPIPVDEFDKLISGSLDGA